jgi:hypothetical protein
VGAARVGAARIGAVLYSISDVREAVARLRGRWPAAAIELRSSAPPPPDLEDALLGGGRSRVLWATVAGGLLGGTVAFLMATLTALAYPLHTGGMPMVSKPPIGIITYEGTALGAILATVVAVLFEGRIWRRSRFEDPLARHLVDGAWVLWIETKDDGSEVEALLRECGAVELATSSGAGGDAGSS